MCSIQIPSKQRLLPYGALTAQSLYGKGLVFGFSDWLFSVQGLNFGK
jgi:hypothetical protein